MPPSGSAIAPGLFARVLSLAALSLCARADVLVVDEAGGPGVDFTDLPPALQAAHQNDLILVRAGSYTAFSTHHKFSWCSRPARAT